MCNKTQQKQHFATILDLGHQRTPLTTRWVAHFWKQTFRCCFKDRFVNARSQPFWSRQGRFEMSQIPETGPIVQILVSTTLSLPRQTRKGAQCSTFQNCSLSNASHLFAADIFKSPSGPQGSIKPCYLILVRRRLEQNVSGLSQNSSRWDANWWTGRWTLYFIESGWAGHWLTAGRKYVFFH